MSLKISQWVGLIGVAVTIPLVQTVAVAKTSVEVGQIAKNITVLITNSSGNGSGVIIKHEGDIYTVLTASHVVSKKVDYKITAPDNRQYEVISSSIITAPGDIDLAVIKFRATTNYSTAKLGNCNLLKDGMEIYVVGFAGKDKAISTPTRLFKRGMVEANATQVQSHGYSLVYDSFTLSGMSGGGVLNTNGELVAIHGEGDTYKKGENNNTNLGISINSFGMVASRMGINLKGQVAEIPNNNTLTADDYYTSGLQKFNLSPKDYGGALADFNHAIQINPNFAPAYIARGNLKISLNNNGNRKIYNSNNQEALADLNRAIQINPNYEGAYLDRAFLKGDRLHDLQGELADLNRLIQINPDANYYYIRGGYKKKLNDFQGALTDYNRAIQGTLIDPDFERAYLDRARLKADKLNDAQGALTDFNRLIQIKPTGNYYYLRGMLKYSKLNDPQGALADFNREIQIKPNEVYYYYGIALVKYDLGDLDGAIRSWRKYLSDLESSSIPVESYDARLGLAVALYKQGQESEAYKIAVKTIRDEKQLTNLDFLRKEHGWSEIIIKDTAKFFQTPKMRSIH